jgi:hypothetical protein
MDAAKYEPDPKPGREIILNLVLEDLKTRAEHGQKKYGTFLMSHNGRDGMMDLYQELLDAVMYIRQLIEEREHPCEKPSK